MFVQDVLAVFIGGGEADWQYRRDPGATSLVLEQRNDLRSNGLLPEFVLEDGADVRGLVGDAGLVLVWRDDEGALQEIGTMEERRRIV